MESFPSPKGVRLTTRILMSFAMIDGGAMFAQWLRNRLMKHYGLYSTDSVYVDFVSARSGACVYGVQDDALVPRHHGNIVLDERKEMLSASKARLIGAKHGDWESLFEAAMSQAGVVLFVLTKGFMNSKWCRQELDGFKVLMDKRPRLRGVVLDLDGIGFDAGARGLPLDRVRLVSSQRQSMQGGMLWDRGLWGISEGAYRELLAAIGPHAEWREA